MAPGEPEAVVHAPEAARLTELRGSARGWQGIQMGVIGFIGLCGVLKDGGTPAPDGVDALAGLLALGSLALACCATFLVGSAAWPLYAPTRAADDAAELRRTSRRLTTGLVLTFVAVALLALSSATGWWPEEQAPAQPQIQIVR